VPQKLVAEAPCSHIVHWFECATDEVASKRQLDGLAQHDVTCSPAGTCKCPGDGIFFGKKCIPRSDWANPYVMLAKKWHEVPLAKEVYRGDQVISENFDGGIGTTKQLSKLPDEKIKAAWLKVRPVGDCLTDWFVNIMKNKRVIDIGAGFARQSLQIALGGAHVTFLDVVDTNLIVIKALCRAFGISERCKFIHLTKLEDLDVLEEYDYMLAFGTQHHMPRELIEEQLKIVLPHLKVGGSWFQLAYPNNRWQTHQDFHQFGQGTDGHATPWGEWYEPGKLLELWDTTSATMQIDFCGIINSSEFIWFGAHRIA